MHGQRAYRFRKLGQYLDDTTHEDPQALKLSHAIRASLALHLSPACRFPSFFEPKSKEFTLNSTVWRSVWRLYCLRAEDCVSNLFLQLHTHTRNQGSSRARGK